MRAFKLKKCKRAHGLHFAPSGGRLLVVGASQVDVVESAIWLDLATGEAVSRIDQLAVRYAVAPDLSRLALLGAHEYDGGLAPIQWTALPGGAGGWHPVPTKVGKGTTVPTSGDLYGIAFDASGELLAIGHDLASRSRDDLGLTVLRLDSGALVGHRSIPDLPGAMAFNPDASRLAVSGGPESGQPVVNVFGLPALTPRFSYKPPGTRTRCVLYLPDGRLVAANARNVYVFPPDEGAPQFVLGGHKGQVNAVAPSPDGGRLLTASHDGAIRVWDAATGGDVAAFDWGIGPVTAVAFSPDGLTAAAAGEKGQVVVWDVDG
jgi:WD40 repeat protein